MRARQCSFRAFQTLTNQSSMHGCTQTTREENEQVKTGDTKRIAFAILFSFLDCLIAHVICILSRLDFMSRRSVTLFIYCSFSLLTYSSFGIVFVSSFRHAQACPSTSNVYWILAEYRNLLAPTAPCIPKYPLAYCFLIPNRSFLQKIPAIKKTPFTGLNTTVISFSHFEELRKP